MCCSEREPGVCFWHSKLRWRGLGLQRVCEMRVSSVGPGNGKQSHPAVCYPRDQRSQLPTTHAPETLASCNIYPLHEPAWQRPVTQQPWKLLLIEPSTQIRRFNMLGFDNPQCTTDLQTWDGFTNPRKVETDFKSLTHEYVMFILDSCFGVQVAFLEKNRAGAFSVDKCKEKFQFRTSNY